MNLLCCLGSHRIEVLSRTASVKLDLPEGFFDKPEDGAFYPFFLAREMNERIRDFLRQELRQEGLLARAFYRFRGNRIQLLIEDKVADTVSGWELDNLMDFLLRSRVLNIGLRRDNEGSPMQYGSNFKFLEWENAVEWKKPISTSRFNYRTVN